MKNKGILIVGLIILAIIVVACVCLLNNKKSKQTNSDVANTFSLKYEGVEVIPGTEFDETQISKEASVIEVPSCAFEGSDKVYTYDNAEITVADVDGKNTVYSVYFINSEMQTNEGVKIGSTKQDMIDKYGSEYEQVLENRFVYTKNNVELAFIIENDTITGIEYTLKTDKAV